MQPFRMRDAKICGLYEKCKYKIDMFTFCLEQLLATKNRIILEDTICVFN